jgi:hypothetical protein
MDSVVIQDVELKSRCHIDGGFNPNKFDFVNTGKALISQIRRRSTDDQEEENSFIQSIHDATFEMKQIEVRL